VTSRLGTGLPLAFFYSVVTEDVFRTQPPSVTVSGTMPTVAAALASWSALLPPMKRAGVSPAPSGRIGDRTSCRERFGSVSIDSACILK